MRQNWDEKKQKLVPGGTTRTEYDDLPVPGGKKVPDLSNAELANVLLGLKVSGVSHKQGRTENLEAYKAHLDALRERAADSAVNAWLKG